MKLTLDVSWYCDITKDISEDILRNLVTSTESMLYGVLYHEGFKCVDSCDESSILIGFDYSVSDKKPTSRFFITVDLQESEKDNYPDVKQELTSVGVDFTEFTIPLLNNQYLNSEGIDAKCVYIIEE